ncbi:MAG TPA: DUF72 domain-containing protein [Vicinamibacterales bacterium]|nr:DUF72 domain-containing protein [Vicinamibacterales bacterium]
MQGEIRVGTSGWSYPSGPGTWTGIFYPADRRVDELAYYAERFDTVEVNSTFYRPPSPQTTRRWAARTPPGFEFSVKLYQKFTHPEMFHKATGGDPFDLGTKDVDEFRRGLAPLAEAGRLGALLVQFPPSFRRDAMALDYLAWLLRAFGEYPLAVELRHRSWSDASEETLALLEEAGAAWVQIDEPKFRFSIRQSFRPNVPGLFYMRLHGRNWAKWWRHETPDERYDYLYTPEELRPLAERVAAARAGVRKAYVYMNNHFAAKAVANAVILRHQLRLPVPGDYPPAFVERYPEVRGLVRVASDG